MKTLLVIAAIWLTCTALAIATVALISFDPFVQVATGGVAVGVATTLSNLYLTR